MLKKKIYKHFEQRNKSMSQNNEMTQNWLKSSGFATDQ